MGVVSQILGKQQRVQFILNNQTIIEIDCTPTQTHSKEAKITKFPVEDGSTIGDHVIIEPDSLSLEGIISDTPISAIGSLLNTAVDHFIPPVGIIAAAAGQALFSAIMGSGSPSVQAYQKLLDLQKAKTPFTVITSLKRYSNMLIESISAPRTAENGTSLVFTMKLGAIDIVKPQSVNITVFMNGDLSAAQQNMGKEEKDNALVDQFNRGQSSFNSLVGH